MPISDYLKKEYSFYDNAETPVEMICDELHLSLLEAKDLVREYLGKRGCPMFIKFSTFCMICSAYLDEVAV